MLNVVHCPACGLKLQVPEDLLRKRVMCPTCNQTFEADTWVLEPEEIATSATGSPLRQTEAHQQAAQQGAFSQASPQQASFQQPFGQTAAPSTAQATPPPRPGPFQAPQPPWISHFDTRPGRVEAIGIMMLVGGIVALSYGGLASKLHFFHIQPALAAYSFVLGIMAIIRGIRILGKRGQFQRSPRTVAIMQIINIINGDVPNLVLGLITLSFLKDPAVRRYFRE
jgi:hypothetical protein